MLLAEKIVRFCVRNGYFIQSHCLFARCLTVDFLQNRSFEEPF